jgi:hypothetical protein
MAHRRTCQRAVAVPRAPADAAERALSIAGVQSQDGDSGKAELERWIEEEVARVREQSRADLAELRVSAAAAADREARLLAAARDDAARAAESLRGELAAARGERDDALARLRSLQRKADVEGAALGAELRLREADAQRAGALSVEKGAQLDQCQQQNDLLHEKARADTAAL